jgi:hypothetical protein
MGGCRAADRLQKLPFRPQAKTNERVGLLDCCWPRLEHLRDLHRKDRRTEGSERGKNAFFNSEDRIEKYSSEVQKPKTSLQTTGGSASPKFSGFCPSVLPVKISRRLRTGAEQLACEPAEQLQTHFGVDLEQGEEGFEFDAESDDGGFGAGLVHALLGPPNI